MAVKLRLARYGGKKNPFYRVIATDERSRRDGRFLEQLGTFDPLKDPAEIRLKMDRVDYWLGVGAKPSHIVRDLVKKFRATGAPTS